MQNEFWKKEIAKGSVLNPVDRISEVLFGLIMVLTFTGAISVATDSRDEITELLWAALGCNVAWGFVDAIMYLMNVAIERGHALTVLEKLDKLKEASSSRDLIKNEMRPVLAAIITNDELEGLCEKLRQLPKPSKSDLLNFRDIVAAFQIFFLVFLCTVPVAVPFAVVDETALALRISNGVALSLLFTGGYLLAGYAGFHRFLTALVYTIIGVALVSLTMLLGG